MVSVSFSQKGENMTESEFVEKFGLSPKLAGEIMDAVDAIVTSEAQTIIEHCDFYMNPTDYCDEEQLIDEYGEDAFEKDDDADGYPNLYDYRKSHSATEVFKRLFSYRTKYAGHTTAIEAINLIDTRGWRE